MNDGLKSSEREAIQQVFSHFPTVRRVTLFGSRATGEHRAASDIDLCLEGAGLTLKDQLSIASAIEELGLRYEVDLVRKQTITNAALLEQIKQHGRPWYDKPSSDRGLDQ